MDAFPIQNGHSLVIPKLEIDNILDLNEIGFFDIINEKKWIFIEWPKKIIKYFEYPYSHIKIKIDDSKKRTLEIKNYEI